MTAEAEAVLDVAPILVPDPQAPAPVPGPAGWTRLPAGPVRRVKVDRSEVGKPDAYPFEVLRSGDRWGEAYAAVVIEGGSRLVHEPEHKDERGCTVYGTVYLETDAALLVCRTPAAALAKVG